jgi:hypothetical protein
LGAASPCLISHCPHPGNRETEGFTDCPVVPMLVEPSVQGRRLPVKS